MSNHGLFEITELEDAQDAWKIFFNRFYSSDLPRQANEKFDSQQREFIPRKASKAKNQRFAWNEETQLAYYSDKDGRTYHSDDFDDFLNGNTVKIPVELNETDFKRVEEAIRLGDYEDDLFKNKYHVFYALWLFKLNKISRQQLSTLLAREQFPEKYPIVKTFLILDEQGEFTEDAKQLLIPILKNNNFTKFEDWHLQRFRLLIQAAPKSEQVFYISECDPHSVTVEENDDKLGNSLLRIGAWERTHYQDRLYDFHLSFGAIEARQIALRGVHGAAANRCTLGKISPGAIKQGVISNYRQTAISINESGVEPTLKGIHDFPLSRMPAVTEHDIYHARIHNSIPPEFHLAFNHIKEIVASFTKVLSSSLQWHLTDREFPIARLQATTLDDDKIGAKSFTELLTHTSQLREQPAYFFNDYSYLNLSEAGIAVIRDMVNDSDKWKKLYKIDINFLGHPYDKMIRNMQAFIQTEAHEPFDAKLFSLRYRLFCDLPKKTYQKASQLVSSLGPTVTDALLFTNESYKNGQALKNKTVLKCNNTVVSDGKSALREVISSYFKSKFTLNKERMHCEFIQLEAEFKSIHEGSQFSTAKLDAACNKLDSLADKLMLLEFCYQHILNTPYVRRHAKIDDFVAGFFPGLKNSLTRSRRKHIGLLKAKMDNLLNEHLSTMTDEPEKQQFTWAIKKYFKLIHYQDWNIDLTAVFMPALLKSMIPRNH